MAIILGNQSETNRPRLDPVGLHRRIPLVPHQMWDRVTRYEDFFSLIHLGVPRIDARNWCMSIGGMVKSPFSITFDDLRQLPKRELTAVHQCAGNPMAPKVPTRRVANVTWGGVDLVAVLERAGVDPEAKFLWSFGADYGHFDGVYCSEYGKDLPLSRVREGDILIAYELNGRPLPAENGFPARLVVPGFYGTNSVKWLTRMELADQRVDNLFTTKYYNDTLPDGTLRPVWGIPVEAIIVEPAPDAAIPLGQPFEVWGWAWAGAGVAKVEVDAGNGWDAAEFEVIRGRSWCRFSFRWVPSAGGSNVLKVRAASANGHIQPNDGARNAVHSVAVVVR